MEPDQRLLVESLVGQSLQVGGTHTHRGLGNSCRWTTRTDPDPSASCSLVPWWYIGTQQLHGRCPPRRQTWCRILPRHDMTWAVFALLHFSSFSVLLKLHKTIDPWLILDLHHPHNFFVRNWCWEAPWGREVMSGWLFCWQCLSATFWPTAPWHSFKCRLLDFYFLQYFTFPLGDNGCQGSKEKECLCLRDKKADYAPFEMFAPSREESCLIEFWGG